MPHLKNTLKLIYIVLIAGYLYADFEDEKKYHMIKDLEIIKHHFDTAYAPSQWKKEYAGWSLENSYEIAKNEILLTPSITTKQFQLILYKFIQTMKDYHVNVSFFSTESATLPFTIRGAEGRYFIDWIDTVQLPPSYYSINIGDELLDFDGRPIEEVIQELSTLHGRFSNPETDRSLAEMNLTVRMGMAGDKVPHGPIMIRTQSVTTGKINSFQLIWKYTPEYIKNPFDYYAPFERIDFLSSFNKFKNKKIQLPKVKMMNMLLHEYSKVTGDRQRGLGSPKSFVPNLGEIIWMKEEQKDSDKQFFTINWHAYIYRHPSGRSIGYIRIPHYVSLMKSAQEFGEIIKFMDEQTDALVIDQLHNFGGFVDFQYHILSMLTIDPMITPYHRIKITQRDVFEAYKVLEMIKWLEMNWPKNQLSISNHDDNEEDEDHDCTELNYQEILFLKNYYELIIDEWNNGHTLTKPTPILGVDRINPHPKYQYTKPILMLIDELDFSGGDFVPAILQDNQRALLFGKRTAGAGGCVTSFEFPNTHGIASCSYTLSLAERRNFQKIENLGVWPDIEYCLTAKEIQEGFSGYIDAVNKTVDYLLEEKTK